MREPLLARFEADVEPVDLAGTASYLATPHKARRTPGTHVLLDFHGGAFVFGGGEINVRFEAASMALRTGCPCYALDYARPPDAPFPAALDQGFAAYRALLERHAAAGIVIAGISAGGNIAAALVGRIIAARLRCPSGLILLTPELDLSESGDSFQTLRDLDRVLTVSLVPPSRLYAGTRALDDPAVSPLFAPVDAFPPTFLQAGTRDLFLSNAVNQHRRLRAAGVTAELHIWDAMPHGGFDGATEEDRQIDTEMQAFLVALET